MKLFSLGLITSLSLFGYSYPPGNFFNTSFIEFHPVLIALSINLILIGQYPSYAKAQSFG